MRAFGEDDVSQPLGEAEFDHESRDVHPDHTNPALLERNRVPAGPDADFEDPLAVELVHEDRKDPGHRPGCKAPCFVVDRGNAVEREAARHHAEHRTSKESDFVPGRHSCIRAYDVPNPYDPPRNSRPSRSWRT